MNIFNNQKLVIPIGFVEQDIVKDTHNYSKKGGKIAINHKCMEESPQMEDRNQLTK